VRFEWEGGLKGSLRVDSSDTALSSTEDILDLARRTGAALSDKELRFLGIATFFAAFRELGHFAAAERELDARNASASFQDGIADLKLHLFPRRSEHRRVLLDAAYAFMLSRLEELQKG